MATVTYPAWQPPRRTRLETARRGFSQLLLLGCVTLAALMLVPALLGYERYVITSGSMTGTYDTGSLVFDEVVPVSELGVGDVITYTPPASAAHEARITHRIVAIERDATGKATYRTKGDANATPDPWTFSLDERTQARVAFHLPYVGYVFSALAVENIRTVVIGIPAALVALAIIVGLWRDAGREARRRSAVGIGRSRGRQSARLTGVLKSKLAILAALVIGGTAFSGATFTALSSNPSNTFATAPMFGELTVTMNDPGSPLRATVTLAAGASDGGDGSNITEVKIQRSPAGANTWTDVCTDTASPYACSLDTTALTDGLYDFQAIATGTGGATKTSDPVVNRRIDNGLPNVAMTDPGANLRASITLEATASDGGSGVAAVKIERSPAGAGTWSDVCTDATQPYSCSLDTTTVSDGLYDFRAVAIDQAGNQQASTVAGRRVDNTVPSASLDDPGSLVSGMTTFSGTASDSGSGVASLAFQASPTGASTWSDICSDTTEPYACSVDTSAMTDGVYDFRSRAADNAGNAADSSTYTRRVDNFAPSVTMNDPGAYLRGSVSLAASASDGGGIASVKIERSAAGANTWTEVCTDATEPYSCPLDTTTLSDGLYDLRATATDNASRASASVLASRRVDNGPPFVTMNDPGANLRGTVSLTAAASDGGSGVASVLVQRSPAGANTWTAVCTDTTDPYACSLDTTTVADGLYDFRAVATDAAGNQAASAVANRRIDNTRPTGTDIQAADGGGTTGKMQAGDTVRFTFSEQLAPASILAGWNGTSLAVTVRVYDGATDTLRVFDNADTTPAALTDAASAGVNLNGNYVPAGGAKFNATMVQAGSSVTITLGALRSGSVNATRVGNATMSWTPSALATDLAGNAVQNTAVTETGAADRDF